MHLAMNLSFMHLKNQGTLSKTVQLSQILNMCAASIWNTAFGFALVIAFFLGLGCKSSNQEGEPPQTLQSVALNMQSLAKGAFSAIQERQRKVITDEAEWKDWWTKHRANRVSPPQSQDRPEINFQNRIVLVATMGRKTTGGYSIEIKEVRPTDGTLQAYVAETSPPEGAMTIMALTAPFHVVSIPRPKPPFKVEFVDAPSPSSSGTGNRESENRNSPTFGPGSTNQQP